jgi:hypothetical protein
MYRQQNNYAKNGEYFSECLQQKKGQVIYCAYLRNNAPIQVIFFFSSFTLT